MDFLKVDYHMRRPYWVSLDIKAGDCDFAFGNPSGHSTGSMGKSLILFLDYAISCKTGPFSHPIVKAIVCTTCVLFAGTVGYSRILLGAHGVDQVIFGFSLGIWIAFTMQFCFSELIKDHAKKLLNRHRG